MTEWKGSDHDPFEALHVSPALGLAACRLSTAQPHIVDNGKARAEIVIAHNPPRMVTLAAQELQTYLKAISGATLIVTNRPTVTVPVRIYVGQSDYTEALNQSVADLKYGAFRIASGADWLALLGVDRDFVPLEPYGRNGGVDERERVMREWDALTGGLWNNPVGKLEPVPLLRGILPGKRTFCAGHV